jgi:hypothetical protein
MLSMGFYILLPKSKRKMRAKNPSPPMSLKPKLSWVAEERSSSS